MIMEPGLNTAYLTVFDYINQEKGSQKSLLRKAELK